MVSFDQEKHDSAREPHMSLSRYHYLLVAIITCAMATNMMAWALYSSSDIIFVLSVVFQTLSGYIFFKKTGGNNITNVTIFFAVMMFTAIIAKIFIFNELFTVGQIFSSLMMLIGGGIIISNKIRETI